MKQKTDNLSLWGQYLHRSTKLNSNEICISKQSRKKIAEGHCVAPYIHVEEIHKFETIGEELSSFPRQEKEKEEMQI